MTELKHCFAPVVDSRTRVLVLGSLPGDASLAAGEYYAHPRNAFWPLVSALTGQPLAGLPYDARLQSLLACGIGLWDVVGQARRKGSLDTALRGAQPNDLAALATSLPALQVLACNGALAYKTVMRDFLPGVLVMALPSTSPAYTLAFAGKLLAWQALLPFVGRSEP
ncbi:DNA-deoxyinosine glycosylase [Craterilacuibacter sp.]|uniref:DNA-deoxyinosine glycosylase n=1 Tax=Craterilacuibacter sp. TaxID=2870909 RepID=UPI003F3D0E66